jgi:hypothetical protein
MALNTINPTHTESWKLQKHFDEMQNAYARDVSVDATSKSLTWNGMIFNRLFKEYNQPRNNWPLLNWQMK